MQCTLAHGRLPQCENHISLLIGIRLAFVPVAKVMVERWHVVIGGERIAPGVSFVVVLRRSFALDFAGVPFGGAGLCWTKPVVEFAEAVGLRLVLVSIPKVCLELTCPSRRQYSTLYQATDLVQMYVLSAVNAS